MIKLGIRRKILNELTVAVITIMCISQTAFANTAIKITLDEKDITPTSVQAELKDGRVFVPLRFVSEKLNCTVDWNADTREVTINNDIVHTVGSSYAIVRSISKAIDIGVPSYIKNGSTMVSVRMISEALGTNISWNGDTKTVAIVSSGQNTTTTEQAETPSQTPAQTVDTSTSEFATYDDYRNAEKELPQFRASGGDYQKYTWIHSFRKLTENTGTITDYLYPASFFSLDPQKNDSDINMLKTKLTISDLEACKVIKVGEDGMPNVLEYKGQIYKAIFLFGEDINLDGRYGWNSVDGSWLSTSIGTFRIPINDHLFGDSYLWVIVSEEAFNRELDRLLEKPKKIAELEKQIEQKENEITRLRDEYDAIVRIPMPDRTPEQEAERYSISDKIKVLEDEINDLQIKISNLHYTY